MSTYWNPATGLEEPVQGSKGAPLVQASMILADSPNADAFGRLRVANAETIFSSQQEYTPDKLHMENYAVGTATATYVQATSSTVLSTLDATSNNRALRQAYVYWRYQPGKSHVIKITGTLAKSGTPAGAAVARIG